MEKSQSIINISGALAKFHATMSKVKKSSENPYFKSKYATLSTIQDAIQEPLKEAGLVYSQFPDGESLTTILIHVESGEYMQASVMMKPVKSDPQSIGSAITYARRYALGAILGLNIDDDDDGNAASGKSGKEQPKKDNEVLQQWQDAISQQKELESLIVFYKSNKKVVDETPEIKALFTKRKTELGG